MIVEIWSDVICPWCYIGKRRFESAVEAFTANHPDVELDVRYRAFMLDPTAPVGSSQPVREAYAKKFGGPEAADSILARVTNEAAGEGLEFRMDIARRSNTALAHRLLTLAEAISDSGRADDGLQARLKERFLAAYFTEGCEVGDPEVLVTMAVEVGIDEDEARNWLAGDGGRREVAAHLEFAADNGIASVPTFVFDREVAIPGAQDPELLLKVLERRHQASTAA